MLWSDFEFKVIKFFDCLSVATQFYEIPQSRLKWVLILNEPSSHQSHNNDTKNVYFCESNLNFRLIVYYPNWQPISFGELKRKIRSLFWSEFNRNLLRYSWYTGHLPTLLNWLGRNQENESLKHLAFWRGLSKRC